MNTLGILIVNSIKLMFDNVGNEISCNNTDEYNLLFANTTYARRLANIFPAVNSGLQQSVKMRAYPSKTFVKNFGYEEYPKFYNLSDEIPDYLRLETVAWYDEDENLKIENNPYMLSNSMLVLPKLDTDYFLEEQIDIEITITYMPKPPQFDISYGLSVDMEIPDDIFSALPYWIKSVLYEVDEPELAIQAKNTFYEMLKIEPIKQETSNYVRNDFTNDY